MTNEPTTTEPLAKHEVGRLDQAEAIYRARLVQFPNDLVTLIGLADVLSDARRTADAEELYRRALAIDGESPDAAGAYDGMAAILQDSGDLDGAISASKKAAMLRGNADDSFGVGNTLEFLGRITDAIDMFVLATQQRAGFGQAHIKAARHLLGAGRAAEAVPHYLVAIEANPSIAELHCNLANAMLQAGDGDRALEVIRRAIELNPRLAEAHHLIGRMWFERDRLSDAAESFRRALAIKPDFADAMRRLVPVLNMMGHIQEAGDVYARLIEFAPDVPQCHQNYGINLLLRGNFEKGWAEYEWRRLTPSNPGIRPFVRPAWDGSPLEGRTIVLFAEQGVGDTIQFLRYVAMVVQRGGRVVIECQPALAEMARQVPGVIQVIAQGESWPNRHVQLPLMSLPWLFGTKLDSIPAEVPYILPDQAKVTEWGEKIKGYGGKKVGIVWAGNSAHVNDKRRSIHPAELKPLGEVPGISYISLQKEGSGSAPECLKLMDFTANLTDFSQTAALIANLDLVISVDTAVAHLAGAVGKPVWILLAAVPDWRWMLDRADSPWYPTAKLFRQGESQTWDPVINAVAAELRGLK